MRNGRLDVANYGQSFCIDPIAVLEVEDHETFDAYARRLKRRVYPLGFREYRYAGSPPYVQGVDAMFIDEDGRVFTYYYHDVLIGTTIEQAIANLSHNGGIGPWDVDSDSPQQPVINRG